LASFGLVDELAHADLDACETYGAYLRICAELVRTLAVDLRRLDRYLWTCKGKPEEHTHDE